MTEIHATALLFVIVMHGMAFAFYSGFRICTAIPINSVTKIAGTPTDMPGYGIVIQRMCGFRSSSGS